MATYLTPPEFTPVPPLDPRADVRLPPGTCVRMYALRSHHSGLLETVAGTLPDGRWFEVMDRGPYASRPLVTVWKSERAYYWDHVPMWEREEVETVDDAMNALCRYYFETGGQ